MNVGHTIVNETIRLRMTDFSYACQRFLNVEQKSCNDAVLEDLGRVSMLIFSNI